MKEKRWSSRRGGSPGSDWVEKEHHHLANGKSVEKAGIKVEAVPMYN